MKDKIIKQFQEFKNTIQTLSQTEKLFAGMVFFIALILPLPGTGPASIIMITAYVDYRTRKKK
jgi:hypothetical protein